jgi:hypothetical protein
MNNRSGGKSSKAGKLGSALTLDQKPNFEMASKDFKTDVINISKHANQNFKIDSGRNDNRVFMIKPHQAVVCVFSCTIKSIFK